jgi:hypothetical protein
MYKFLEFLLLIMVKILEYILDPDLIFLSVLDPDSM